MIPTCIARCVNLQTDVDSCGACSNTCAHLPGLATGACAGGACQPCPSPSYLPAGGSACVSPDVTYTYLADPLDSTESSTCDGQPAGTFQSASQFTFSDQLPQGATVTAIEVVNEQAAMCSPQRGVSLNDASNKLGDMQGSTAAASCGTCDDIFSDSVYQLSANGGGSGVPGYLVGATNTLTFDTPLYSNSLQTPALGYSLKVLVSAVCPAGNAVCDGVCVDLKTDVLNCGMCGVACDVACDEGVCRVVPPPF